MKRAAFIAAALSLTACRFTDNGGEPAWQTAEVEPRSTAGPLAPADPALPPEAPVTLPGVADASSELAAGPADPVWREVFPGVRLAAGLRAVEFDGIVPIDAHDPKTPLVFLEQIACRPDSKEHEALVMSDALASHIHAALLLTGLEPGSTGSWSWDGDVLTTVPPSGGALRVEVIHREEGGVVRAWSPNDWIVNERTGEHPSFRWVFAGSRIMRRGGVDRYDADGTGLLVGLTTFGSEVIAASTVISHEAQVQAPEWIADARVVPRFGTPVVVRLIAE